MYAVVNIQGDQIKVEKDQKIYVNRLDAKEGDKLNFDQVVLVDNGGKIAVGTPTVKGASVSAKVIQHLKACTVHFMRIKMALLCLMIVIPYSRILHH